MEHRNSDSLLSISSSHHIHNEGRTMKRVSLRLTLLSLAAAILMTGLPAFTTASTMQLELPRPAARRRAPRAARTPRATRTLAVVPLGTNLRVRLNDDLSSKNSRV